MEHYDVIIIGAGPAGLKCAEILGRSKLRVLILEKNKKIGRKVCAGGLSSLAFDFTSYRKGRKFSNQTYILNGKKTKIKLEMPIITFEREKLAEHQLRIIKKFKNIKIKSGIIVKEIHEEYLKTGSGKVYSFNKLVGADGANSVVREFLGLKSRIFFGVQYVIPGKYNEFVWILEPRLIGDNYAWIFPRDNSISMGVTSFDSFKVSIKKSREILGRYIERFGLDGKDARFEAGSINSLFEGVCFGKDKNFFLIGDAAGLASAGTGEGISSALISGHDVGKCILEGSYHFKNLKKLLKFKRRQDLLLRLQDKMPFLSGKDFLMNIFVFGMRFHIFQKFFGFGRRLKRIE